VLLIAANLMCVHVSFACAAHSSIVAVPEFSRQYKAVRGKSSKIGSSSGQRHLHGCQCITMTLLTKDDGSKV